MTEFLYGLGWEGEANNLQYTQQLGANAVRVNIAWNSVEPYLLPKCGSYSVDWSRADNQISPYIDAGLHVIARVGFGIHGYMPLVSDTARLTPDHDDYIYYMCRHAQNLIKRYKGKVYSWMIEGELNESQLTTLFGWRNGDKWKDPSFLTGLIKAMSGAIKEADPKTPTMICFHTDIHDNLHHHPLGCAVAGKFSWKEWLCEWRDYMDIVGIDAYPNYYIADPIRGHEVGEKVAEARANVDKPVMVMETAYPVPAPGETLPEPVNFTEEKQMEYVRAALETSKSAGAQGFFYFSTKAVGVRNRYTQKDLQALRVVAPAFHDGDVNAIVPFVIGNMSYCQSKMPEVLQYVESGLGIVRNDDSVRPAFTYLRSQYAPDSQDVQRIQLVEGWNLFSLSVKPASSDIREVLASIEGKYKTVWTRDGENWLWYISEAPSASNLRKIEAGVGYWINMRESATLTLEGEPADVAVELHEGWNLVGYPHRETLDVREYLEPLKGKYRSIWENDPVAGWRWYIPGSPVSSSLSIVRPGFGYWIDVIEPCILRAYPKT